MPSPLDYMSSYSLLISYVNCVSCTATCYCKGFDIRLLLSSSSSSVITVFYTGLWFHGLMCYLTFLCTFWDAWDLDAFLLLWFIHHAGISWPSGWNDLVVLLSLSKVICKNSIFIDLRAILLLESLLAIPFPSEPPWAQSKSVKSFYYYSHKFNNGDSYIFFLICSSLYWSKLYPIYSLADRSSYLGI